VELLSEKSSEPGLPLIEQTRGDRCAGCTVDSQRAGVDYVIIQLVSDHQRLAGLQHGDNMRTGRLVQSGQSYKHVIV
jgi:hypothetical protein